MDYRTALHEKELESWLKKRRSLTQTISCGLHSGFPLCCILWFVTVWKVLISNPKLTSLADKYHEFKDDPLRFYVACPVCKIRNKRYNVQECHLHETGDCFPTGRYNVLVSSQDEKCTPATNWLFEVLENEESN